MTSIRQNYRENVLGVGGRLSPELLDILRRNGIVAAGLYSKDGQIHLYVQGHDSPPCDYTITSRQYHALCDGGTNSSNRLAYNTFADIVKNDFDCPIDYINAKNAHSRVNMGQNGHRVGRYPCPRYHEYSFGRHSMLPPRYLGWAPCGRHFGLDGRRINGHFVPFDTGWVGDRPGGYLRPGELPAGGYGFYYKGRSQQQQTLPDLQVAVNSMPVEDAPQPRRDEPAIPYSSVITSTGFTNQEWQRVLSSHGIVVDAEKKTMLIQSKAEKQDTLYYLTAEQTEALTSNDDTKYPVGKRIDLINSVISKDYQDKVTKEMLESKDRISLRFTPEHAQEVKLQEESRQRELQEAAAIQRGEQQQQQRPIGWNEGEVGVVDGSAIARVNGSKGWYREGNHGREVTVGHIWVEPVYKQDTSHGILIRDGDKYNVVELSQEEMKRAINDPTTVAAIYKEKTGNDLPKDADVLLPEEGTLKQDENGKWQYDPSLKDEAFEGYRMSAYIDGERKDKWISQKDYNKFMALDDYHRMKLFSKTFDDVDMKTLPECRMSFGQGLMAFLGATNTLADTVATVAYDYHEARLAIEGPHHHHHHPGPPPPGPSVYYKAGVDTPLDVAARQYNTLVAQAEAHGGRGFGR